MTESNVSLVDTVTGTLNRSALAERLNRKILKGEMDSRNWDKEISYEWISLPYDYEKELRENEDNIERKEYEQELRHGWYRDMAKVYRMAKELQK